MYKDIDLVIPELPKSLTLIYRHTPKTGESYSLISGNEDLAQPLNHSQYKFLDTIFTGYQGYANTHRRVIDKEGCFSYIQTITAPKQYVRLGYVTDIVKMLKKVRRKKVITLLPGGMLSDPNIAVNYHTLQNLFPNTNLDLIPKRFKYDAKLVQID